ncbi:membrane protein [Ralstonia pickettii DTP0602]|nr:membrane protein [Ralstonia pickettii DTP0602]
MKQSAMAAALCACVAGMGHAHAQSVTIYGVVDTGIEFVSNVGTSKDNLVRMPGLAGTVPSRWGLRGTEDLGGGLKSQFVLESGFAPDTGASNQGGRLFGRQAWVGLSGNWGQVAFGRQYTMLFWSMLEPDMLGPNTFGSSSLDSYLPSARTDNAVSYKGAFGPLTVGGTYSFGRDTVNAGPGPSGTNCAGENPADHRACREWSVLLKYDTSTWGASAAYDSIRGGTGAFGGLTNSGLKDDRLTVNGYANIGKGKVGGGWLRRDNDGSTTPRSDMWFLGASYALTPALSVDAEAFYLRFHDSANKAWLYAARTTYTFSKRTSIDGTAGFLDNRGNLALSVSSGAAGANAAPGGNQFGAMVGVKHIF